MPSVRPDAAGTASTAKATPRHQRARAQPSAIRAVIKVTRSGSPSQVSAVSTGEVGPSWLWIQRSTEASNGPAWVWPAYLIARAATTATQTAMTTAAARRVARREQRAGRAARRDLPLNAPTPSAQCMNPE